MRRSFESANVLSGIALICGPRPGPTFLADHTVIGTGDHRLLIGRISVASTNDCYGRHHQFQLSPRMSGIGAVRPEPARGKPSQDAPLQPSPLSHANSR